ncbi:unnamed protein product [Arabidopsis halleri]
MDVDTITQPEATLGPKLGTEHHQNHLVPSHILQLSSRMGSSVVMLSDGKFVSCC